MFSILQVFDLLGTIAFAASGALAAMNKRLDIFGVLIIVFVTAVGGGTLRDIMIGHTPVSWMRDRSVIFTLLGTYGICIFAKPYIHHLRKPLFYFDSFGLGAFVVTGIIQGINYGLHPALCVALGTMTGVFGGVLRDILLNEIPHVFRKEIYATACIAGGSLYFILQYFNVDKNITDVTTALVIVAIRLISYKRRWSLPTIYH